MKATIVQFNSELTHIHEFSVIYRKKAMPIITNSLAI